MPARGPPMAEAVVENRRLRRPEPEPALDQLGPETRVDRVFPRPALMRTIVRRVVTKFVDFRGSGVPLLAAALPDLVVWLSALATGWVGHSM